MALDLRPITRVEMFIERLELPADTTVKFIYNDGEDGWKTWHTLTKRDDWSMVDIENLYINVDFLRFSILEFPGFEQILAKTEAIFFEGVAYKFERQHKPIGINRVWTFKLEPLEDYPTITLADPPDYAIQFLGSEITFLGSHITITP